MATFDKKRFSQLLQKAIGNRNMSEYALHAGISLTYLSELMRALRDNPPMPPTIKKLADKAYNDVSYEELLEAAGHAAEQKKIDLVDALDDKNIELLAGGQLISPKQRLGIAHILNDPHNPLDVKAATLPLLGSISAGIPLLSEQNIIGLIDIPVDLIGRADFALIVNGDSMIGAGIHEGDIAVCKEDKEASNGQIVVARVNQDETTLKYYFRENGKAVLRAANPVYRDIELKPGDEIQGHVVKVFKEPPQVNTYREYLYCKEEHLQEWNGVIEKATAAGIKPLVIGEMINAQLEIAKRLTGK